MSSPEEDAGELGRHPRQHGGRTALHAAMVVGVVGVTTAGVVFVSSLDDAPQLTPFATPSGALVQPERLTPDLDRTPVDAATIDWLSGLQTAVQDDPDFGTVAISEDRATVTVTWFGEPSATLHEQVDAAPANLRVVIRAAAFPTAELQGLVQEAMRPGLLPDIQVTSGGLENDGSGLHLGIAELPAGRTLEGVAHDIAAALDRSDVPVSVEVTGEMVPIAGRR